MASAAALAADPNSPGYGMIPRDETGVARFLAEHPTYDGRGVVVAIFDTGVDPGAPGMQITTDGKPKIIDLVDGSGSGDVDTSTVVEPNDGVIKGLSGRSLTLNPAWKNPGGKYRLGLKRAFDLFPEELNERLKARRQEKKWDPQQRAAVAAVKAQMAAWDAENPSPDVQKKKERDDLDRRLAALDALQEEYDDPGPIHDCVVWHDGEVWRAAIDTDEDGDLADEKALTNFRTERQYATFSDEDLMNFAVNIYRDGDLLSIICDSGSHGTHVAGIVAANFPDQPELNGVAPGAQIVGVKIGDTRIGSSSVGTGEIRGCVAVLENKCDLINMSYGGPTADPDHGRMPEIYSELVNKHNVIFVASAGNEGPALSTVGGPGATTEALFGVGAYVSPQMAVGQYALRERVPAVQFTWSSRGPTTDGALGVKFSAPGAAIAPVPNWELKRNMLMNGTSMAAPNACGGIALLLSGMKAEGHEATPRQVRRALENTAVGVDGVEVFALGAGLIQIDRAYDFLASNLEFADSDLRLEARVPARRNARGIYLREPHETSRPTEARVIVTPVFHDDAPNRSKVDFELFCTLESTAPWVQCGQELALMHDGRRLDIRVDPTNLPSGVHFAEIRGFDALRKERGPVFRLPVTVVRPQEVAEFGPQSWVEQVALRSGRIERRFLAAPEGATWADIRVQRLDDEEPRLVLLHVVQLRPGRHYHQDEFQEYMTLGPGADVVKSMAVEGGRTMELCLAQFWSSLGECELSVEVTFHGLAPDSRTIALEGGQIATPISLSAALGPERLGPKGSLDVLRRTIRPGKTEQRPLTGPRDLLPEQRQVYEMIHEYSFTLDDKAKVTPRLALGEIPEFEDTWQSQIYMVFDAGKRLVATGSADPKQVSLEKGEYVVRHHVRHDDPALLSKLEHLPLLVDIELEKPLALAFYADPDDVFAGRKFSARTLMPGERAVVWAAPPAADAAPKFSKPGDVLIGAVRFGAADDKLPGAGERPDGYPVVCTVAPKPAEPPDAPEPKEEKTAAQKAAEAIRDARVAQLAALRDPNDAAVFDAIAADVLREFPDHLPVLLEQLRRADGDKRKDDLRAVIGAADRIVGEIDETALAAHYGVKLDDDDLEARRARKRMDEKKKALIEALHRRAKALHDIAAEKPDAEGAAAEKEAQAAFAALAKWTDTTATEYIGLHVQRMAAEGRLGEAIELMNKRVAEEPTEKKLYDERIALLDELGWVHWKAYEEAWAHARFPSAYPPF